MTISLLYLTLAIYIVDLYRNLIRLYLMLSSLRDGKISLVLLRLNLIGVFT